MTVKTALSELENAGLIERRRSGFSKPNRIYVKLPSDGQKFFQTTDRNPSSIGIENCPTDGKKIVPMTDRKLSTNNLRSRNLNQNHMSRESEAPATYGDVYKRQGLGIWGGINLMEGYGNDNPGAKSQGMKQLMAGGGVALIGLCLLYTSRCV